MPQVELKTAPALIPRLALADLRHEWILTLCMVLAVTAVVAPLLILLGLKHGTVETLRDRLVEDPVNREIRPARTLQLTQGWFDEIRQRPDVQFVVPTILRGSSLVRAEDADGQSETLDLVPTAPADPLLLENGAKMPDEGEVVLSHAAATELNLQAGQNLTLSVTRVYNNRREAVETTARILAVLNPRADRLARIYAPAAWVEDVETYREGLAVPARNWSGGDARPFLSYDGAWLLTPEPLTPLQQNRAVVNTGFTRLQALKPEAFQQASGFAPPPEWLVYTLQAQGQPVQPRSFKLARQALRGHPLILLPFAENIVLHTEEALPVVGLSLSSREAGQLGLPAPPWGAFDAGRGFTEQARLCAPDTLALESAALKVNVKMVNGWLRFPMTMTSCDSPLDSFRQAQGTQVAVVPTELVGTLRTAQMKPVAYDAARQDFVLKKSGYRGFRLYTRSIDDVPALYNFFVGQDIEVVTQVREIERIKILDRGLTRIFWLIAVVGIFGGVAALIASLYAAVERKKRDLGVLRLMGLSRAEVFRFPIYQGLAIAVTGTLLAGVVYQLLAVIINLAFASDLDMGQKICRLPLNYFIFAVLMTIALAMLSSLLAAWKTTGIDPAQAIREE